MFLDGVFTQRVHRHQRERHRASAVGNAAVLEPCAFCNCCTNPPNADPPASSNNAADYSVRSGNPVALELACEGGCTHRSCGACVATLSQGCPDCGRSIQSMVPLAAQPHLVDKPPVPPARHVPTPAAKPLSPTVVRRHNLLHWSLVRYYAVKGRAK